MSKRSRGFSRKELERIRQQAADAERASKQAQDLTDDGYPVGHPLRALCLLNSGPAGVAQYAFEQTQAVIKKKGGKK